MSYRRLALGEVDSALRNKSRPRLEALPLTPCFTERIPNHALLYYRTVENGKAYQGIVLKMQISVIKSENAL